MHIVHRTPGPRVVVRGRDELLTLALYDSADQPIVPTAATVEVRIGGQTIAGPVAADTLEPTAYTLAAAVTEGRQTSDRWLEVWRVTIAGRVEEVAVSGHLARRRYYPTVTQRDLLERHRSLNRLRHPEDPSWAIPLELGRQHIERDLLKKGRRQWLVFDNWAFHDAHAAIALYYIFGDAALASSGTDYEAERDRYLEIYHREMASIAFRWDTEDSGSIDSAAQEATGGPIALTAGPRRWRGVW